jgi:hypothetical protein
VADTRLDHIFTESIDSVRESKNKKPDRILVLKIKDGEKGALNSIGVLDKRLFTGENNLHAIMDKETCLWSLKYDAGGIPYAMKQQFTSFSTLYKFVEAYLKKRNIEIEEVIE